MIRWCPSCRTFIAPTRSQAWHEATDDHQKKLREPERRSQNGTRTERNDEMSRKPNVKPNVGVGSPAILRLNVFGDLVEDAFGSTAYLVGSAVRGKVWRDVDVRVILSDRRFRHWFGDPYNAYELNPRWRSVAMAYSALGLSMTGLPIDFQPQSQGRANVLFPLATNARVALFEVRDQAVTERTERTTR